METVAGDVWPLAGRDRGWWDGWDAGGTRPGPAQQPVNPGRAAGARSGLRLRPLRQKLALDARSPTLPAAPAPRAPPPDAAPDGHRWAPAGAGAASVGAALRPASAASRASRASRGAPASADLAWGPRSAPNPRTLFLRARPPPRTHLLSLPPEWTRATRTAGIVTSVVHQL